MSYPCPECGRQPGNGANCVRCGQYIPRPPSSDDETSTEQPASPPISQLEAVEAARRLLAAARANKNAEETNDE